jgi:hypothetical protein
MPSPFRIISPPRVGEGSGGEVNTAAQADSAAYRLTRAQFPMSLARLVTFPTNALFPSAVL